MHIEHSNGLGGGIPSVSQVLTSSNDILAGEFLTKLISPGLSLLIGMNTGKARNHIDFNLRR